MIVVAHVSAVRPRAWEPLPAAAWWPSARVTVIGVYVRQSLVAWFTSAPGAPWARIGVLCTCAQLEVHTTAHFGRANVVKS